MADRARLHEELEATDRSWLARECQATLQQLHREAMALAPAVPELDIAELVRLVAASGRASGAMAAVDAELRQRLQPARGPPAPPAAGAAVAPGAAGAAARGPEVVQALPLAVRLHGSSFENRMHTSHFWQAEVAAIAHRQWSLTFDWCAFAADRHVRGLVFAGGAPFTPCHDRE